MPGHVFIVHGDLLRLHCDAWLLPTDVHLDVRPYWRVDPRRPDAPPWSLPEGAGPHPGRPVPLDAVAPDVVREGPRPWLVDVAGDGRHPVDSAIAGARRFLQEVAADLNGRAPVTGRVRPLLALPVVGTGDAAGSRTTGEILRELLVVLDAAAASLHVDVVLVCRKGVHFAAAQEVRRRHRPHWDDLEDGLLEEAKQLVRRGEDGALVLFLGAGVSAGAGLPVWGRLLEEVAAEVVEAPLRRAFDELGYLDRARILERRLGAEVLQERVAEAVRGERHALAHALLAGLPVAEVVTTNYDTLFEYASEAAERAVRVLPWQRPVPGQRWLLKLHGCAERDRDQIVLTREDYLRYADRNAALSGIVQSLLITRHMLFVGFSLDDENFHRIADAVRRAARQEAPDAPHVYGTVVDLFENPLKGELWTGDLRVVGMSPPTDGGEAVRAAARRLEVFLDAVACFAATGTPYLLDADYKGLRTEAEEHLRGMLERLGRDLSRHGAARETPAGRQVLRWLEKLGWDER